VAAFDALEWCRSQQVFTPEAIVDHLALALLAGPPTAAERAELAKALGALPPPSEWQQSREEIQTRLADVLRLMMTMATYQLT
jgi:hypothetical protein